jgi:hypothetical protein
MKLDIHKKESGGGIVLVMTTLSILVVIVAVAMVYTNNITRMVQRSNTLEQAVAIGEGSIDTLFGYWRETCRMSPDPSTVLAASSFTGVPLPTGVWQDATTQFPDVPNFTATASATTGFVVSNYKVQALDPVDPTYSPLGASTKPSPAVGRNDGGGDMAKATTTYYYLASTDVTLPTLKGDISAKVRRIFEKQQISPWNYAIFYIDPLEIHPGDDFNVTGEIHTNATLYTAHNYLHFMDKVTFGIDWDNNFAPGDPRRGVETPTMPSYPANLPPAHDVAHQPFGLDSLRIFNPQPDGNPNNDSYHELLEKPIAGSPDPLAGKRYYDQACIVIDIAANNTVTIIKHKDNGNYWAVAPGSPLYDAVMPAISKMTSDTQYIQDNREASKMRLTTLDVSVLRANLSAADDESSWTWNGVIYISDSSPAPSPAPTTPSSAYKPGIRLKNGKVIMNGGLTVASPNPIYIQGDYNTGSGTVPSNATSNNDPTQPQSAGYSRQPCAVLADAVTLLSSSWNDANASGTNALSDLNQRVASNTTVNTAIVSGIVPTTTGSYSGGAENFPRFLEDWSNKKMTYYGSMVELFNSVQSKGKWGSAKVYGVPERQWYFDNNFQISTPPGSLMVYSYIKGKWWLAP